MSDPEDGPPGRIRSFVDIRPPDLSGVTSKALANELLSRLLSEQLRAKPDRYEDDADEFGALGLELQRRFDVDSNRFSRTNLAKRIETYFGGDLQGIPPPIRDATIVELGCGSRNPMAVLFALVLLGARRGIGVDLDSVADAREALRAMARCAAWMLTDPRLLVGNYPITREQVAQNLAESSFDLAKLFDGDAGGADRTRLDFRRESVAKMSFADGEIDLCCSTSFLEHVDDVEAAIAEIARVTKRGGRGAHVVDGIDHRSYSSPEVHPLQFLRESADAPLLFGCNRIRPRTFVPLFERHGFELIQFLEWRRHEVDAEVQASFAEPFRSMQRADLTCTGATIWVRKR